MKMPLIKTPMKDRLSIRLKRAMRLTLASTFAAAIFVGCAQTQSADGNTSSNSGETKAVQRSDMMSGSGMSAAERIAGVELVSRDVILGNPEAIQARLSPDGEHISFLRNIDGTMNIWLADVDNFHETQRPLTHETERSIFGASWGIDGKEMFFHRDTDGDERMHVWAVNVANGEMRDLTPENGARVQLAGQDPENPQYIYTMYNSPGKFVPDWVRVNIETSEKEVLFTNPGLYMGFACDFEGKLQLALQMNPMKQVVEILLRDEKNADPESGEAPMKVWREISFEDLLNIDLHGVDRTGRIFYYSDVADSDTSTMKAHNILTGEEEILFHDPRCDVGEVITHPVYGTPQAVSFEYEKTDWKVIDQSIADDLRLLKQVDPGQMHIVSRSGNDQMWLVAFGGDSRGVDYYLWFRAKRKARFLFSGWQAIEKAPLQPMKPVVIPSRDGLNLVSYLTLPAVEKNTEGMPGAPVPMVLLVHGGPQARDSWGFQPEHQLLANRGYAVLSVNYRGSTGFGKSFINAGDRQWGRAMHDDLIDAVNWAVEKGIADPAKVAIMGASYGGYATLWGLTNTPEVFVCGVDTVGPSNLETLLANSPAWWQNSLPLLYRRMGDPNTEEGRALLAERSPINYVENITKPLLIGQGANDPRVTQVESDQMVEAMQKLGIPVTYILFPDEGHGFSRPENNKPYYAAVEAFLAKHLGGRFEPMGDDLTGSSMQVKAGAFEVPGLGEALGLEKPAPVEEKKEGDIGLKVSEGSGNENPPEENK